jgi:hypothetical protein
VSQELDAVPENFVARVADLLAEAAADGAVLVEVRFGNETALRLSRRPSCSTSPVP